MTFEETQRISEPRPHEPRTRGIVHSYLGWQTVLRAQGWRLRVAEEDLG